MAMITITGMFQGAYLVDGKKGKYIQLDIYQPETPSNQRTVTVKCEDLSLYETFKSDYAFGSVISVDCSLNVFNNKAYFKLIRVVS